MTLEEYCSQVIEKLKTCRDVRQARDLLAEVDLVLGNSGISNGTQKTFWATLLNQLDVVEQDSTVRLEKGVGAELGAVIAAARGAIYEYGVLVGCDEQKS